VTAVKAGATQYLLVSVHEIKGVGESPKFLGMGRNPTGPYVREYSFYTKLSSAKHPKARVAVKKRQVK